MVRGESGNTAEVGGTKVDPVKSDIPMAGLIIAVPVQMKPGAVVLSIKRQGIHMRRWNVIE